MSSETTLSALNEGNAHGHSQNNLVFAPNHSTAIIPTLDVDVLWYIKLINWGVADQILSLFGVITNSINIIVFTRLGVKDPMNVTLLGLSISDFFCCFTSIWVNITFTPGFADLDLPFVPYALHDLIVTWPHYMFVKITCTMTACITIERWMCVTFALRVKELVTTRRLVILTSIVYVTMIGFGSPVYYLFRLAWVFDPSRNKTILTGIPPQSKADVDGYVLLRTLYFVVLPVVQLFVVVLFTVLLVYNLRKSFKWRNTATGKSTTSSSSSSSSSQISPKDAKVTRMVIMMSTLFISCFFPDVMMTLVAMTVPGFQGAGNSAQAMFSFTFLLQNINSSLNLFIYYTMSSNYKSMFQKTFGRVNKDSNGNQAT